MRRPGANRATCVVEVGVSLPRRISGPVILVMSGRGRMMYQCLQPEPEGAILPKRSAPQEVTSSPHDAGASMANWLVTNIQGGGVAPTPSPQNRTGTFQHIRLKHRTTPLRGPTRRGSTGPRHPLQSAVAPLALGSTWTVLRQSRRPKIGGGRTTGVAARVRSALPPSRLAVGSHPPTPGGSQLAFARGDLATPIRPATG